MQYNNNQNNNGYNGGYNNNGSNNQPNNNTGNFNSNTNSNSGNRNYPSQGGSKPWNNNGGRFSGSRNFSRPKEAEEVATRLYKPYVVTTNQNAPGDVAERIRRTALVLQKNGFTARLDGMEGVSDLLKNVVNDNEMYIPWKNFRDINSKHSYNSPSNMSIAKIFHGNFDAMKDTVKAFLSKNVRMVLGKDIKSSCMFVITWTEDGCESDKERSQRTGNMSHVIGMATAMRIPVFNFQKEDAESRLFGWLELDMKELSMIDQVSHVENVPLQNHQNVPQYNNQPQHNTQQPQYQNQQQQPQYQNNQPNYQSNQQGYSGQGNFNTPEISPDNLGNF